MQNVNVCGKLALERCRFNLAQMTALLYFSEDVPEEQRVALESLIVDLNRDIDFLDTEC